MTKSRKTKPTVTVNLTLPTTLFVEITALLEERGIDLSSVIRLYLRSMLTAARSARLLDLDAEMPWGKFRGERMNVLIRTEAQYVRWCVAQCGLRLDPACLALLENIDPVDENEDDDPRGRDYADEA